MEHYYKKNDDAVWGVHTTFGHHIDSLENGIGQLGDGVILVVGLILAQQRGIRAKHKVNARIRNQVGLKLVDIDIQTSIEAERGGQRGNHLGDQAIQIVVGRSLDIQILLADIITITLEWKERKSVHQS